MACNGLQKGACVIEGRIDDPEYDKMYLVDFLLLNNFDTGRQIVEITIVCLTVFFTAIVAKLVGSALPIIAKKIGFDPAVMASPFITTIVDAISLIIYFVMAILLL